MKLSFKMTADDYYIGWRLKNKKCKIPKNSNPVLPAIVAIIIIVSLLILNEYIYMLCFCLLTAIFIASTKGSEKKNVKMQFQQSVVLRGMHTINTYDEGLEILNGYEKLFVPWQSVFCIKETEEHLIILPTYRKGIIVINKMNNSSPELSGIIDILRKNVKVEEGR